MSQPSGTSGMEDHSQNDPTTRDQDEVIGRAATATCMFDRSGRQTVALWVSLEAVGGQWHYGYH